jgi:hypothetical protein
MRGTPLLDFEDVMSAENVVQAEDPRRLVHEGADDQSHVESLVLHMRGDCAQANAEGGA